MLIWKASNKQHFIWRFPFPHLKDISGEQGALFQQSREGIVYYY